MDETNLLLKKWLDRKDEKREEDKHPCLTCRDACFPYYFCAKICALPLVRMREKELDELERKTRPIRIDWGGFLQEETPK